MLYESKDGRTAYMFETAKAWRVSVQGERKDHAFDTRQQAESWLARNGFELI